MDGCTEWQTDATEFGHLTSSWNWTKYDDFVWQEHFKIGDFSVFTEKYQLSPGLILRRNFFRVLENCPKAMRKKNWKQEITSRSTRRRKKTKKNWRCKTCPKIKVKKKKIVISKGVTPKQNMQKFISTKIEIKKMNTKKSVKIQLAAQKSPLKYSAHT